MNDNDKILLAASSIISGKEFIQIAEQEGLTLNITLVGSGEEALLASRSDAYDLLIAELSLIGMPGDELCRQIKASNPKIQTLCLACLKFVYYFFSISSLNIPITQAQYFPTE